MGHCFTLGLGTDSGQVGRDLEWLLCSQPCHCQTARKTTAAAGETAAALAHQTGMECLAYPLPVSGFCHSHSPAGRDSQPPPTLSHLRCPSPREGPRECSVPSSGNQEGFRVSYTGAASMFSPITSPAGHWRTFLSPHLARSWRLCFVTQGRGTHSGDRIVWGHLDTT